ncbi:MAG: CubicO group peptidase (beta-lactamase class C family) [Candidatus Azotimanducaceae bacterium]|jgi:CubicO group peptidase (beta-lactamase class C family)|tara:strand:- start:1022 stop:2359 length:1338 start_codon:yes stop_codon:yes gene_type:complete
MKKLIVLLLILSLPFIGMNLLGLSPFDLKANVQVGTGIGAKLACSGRYLSGFDAQQVAADIASYSAAAELLAIDYDDVEKTASASLFGLGATTAKFRPGLGCTLVRAGSAQLDDIVVPKVAESLQPWPKGSIVSSLSAPAQSLLEAVLEQDNNEGLQTRALLVVRDGSIIGEAYAKGFSPQTPLMGWSMGKSLSAIMLGHLAFSEKLGMGEANLFSEWSADERRNITLRQLLQMSSGLGFSEVYAPGSDATRMLFIAASASGVAKTSALIHPPGSHFSYSSGTANLLSEVFVNSTGGTQAAVNILHNEILAPMAMAHTTLEVDANGVFVGSSNIYSSTRDWARLGLLMLQEGELNGHRILSKQWVAEATRPNDSDNERAYGYQVWLNQGDQALRWPDLPADAYAFTGNRGQRVMIIPSQQTLVVRMGWSSVSYPDNQRFAEIFSL